MKFIFRSNLAASLSMSHSNSEWGLASAIIGDQPALAAFASAQLPNEVVHGLQPPQISAVIESCVKLIA